MNIHWLTLSGRRILFIVMIVTLLVSMSGASVVHAKSASGTLASTLSASDSCNGSVIYLSGVTASRYSNNSVANGTTFDRTAWYSDAVGTNGEDTAFSVGNGAPPPYDVCVLGGVINGHIPLSWSWDEATNFGGSGDRTYTGHLAQVDGARIHNVVDGWKPRELPEFGNTGIMQMRNTYMTGIRDDAIENDDFMPGSIEDSLFDGIRTFLSEQNQSGGTPVTVGPNEDPYIRITRVYVRLYPTNTNGTESPGRWFKWQPLGTVSHNLIITDSVFASDALPKGGWSALSFPAGTTFQGTNYILWLGTGPYEATIPPGVIFLEGQAALDKWNQVRNTWLAAHGYDPRPLDDLNPMDDPVVAPMSISISGNAGIPGAVLSYTDGTQKTAISQSDGSYFIPVPKGWSGTVTPSYSCYTFNPVSLNYSNVTTSKTAQNYTPTFNPGPQCKNLNVTIGGNAMGNYSVPPGTDLKVSYPNIDNGPVIVAGVPGMPIISSLRDLWWNGSAYTSSIQVMGLPQSQLSDTYLFPSYNNVTLNEQLRFGNVGNASTTVTVTIGGVLMGSYVLAPNQRQKVNYAGVDNGPVVVHSSNGVPIIASVRDAWINNGITTSFSQLMGLPQSQLSDTYLFPSYNNVTLNDQLRFGNVGSAPTTVTVTIGGTLMGTYNLAPNQREKVNFAGVDNGPVVVHSSNGVPIIVSLREAWIKNGVTTSYFQMMGLPESQLSDEYVFPVYDNVILNEQLRFGNVGNTQTTVTVTIAGQLMGTFTLLPNQREKVSYPGINDGPVVVHASSGVPIIVSLRDAWLINGATTSFSQLIGLPVEQMSTTYIFPSYNSVTYDNELRIAVP